MPRWDIQPMGVRGVLKRTETQAADLGTAIDSVVTDLESCGTAIGQSIVAKALADFATARGPELKGAAARIRSAMSGTVSAVNAYMAGNLEMAKHAQAAATTTKNT